MSAADVSVSVEEVDEFCRRQSPPWGYEFTPWNTLRGQGEGLPLVRDETMPMYAISVDDEDDEDGCPEFYEGRTWDEALELACRMTGVPFVAHPSRHEEGAP